MKEVVSENRDRGFSIKTKGFHANENEILVALTCQEEQMNENMKPNEKAVMDSLSHVLMDSSTKYANDYQGPRAQEKTRKTQTPLLQKLKIFQASGSSEGNCNARRLLPKEVIIHSQDSGCETGASTVFSDLAVEGLLSAASEERRWPSRFTFDVVPSKSSLDESEAHFDPILAIRSPAVSSLFHGLEFEIDDLSEPSPHPDYTCREMESFDPIMAVRSDFVEEMIGGVPKLIDGLEFEVDDLAELPPHNRGGHKCHGNRERSRTESTEMSIELSESQFFRSADVDQIYNIFSPQNSTTAEPVDHGFDVVQQPTNDQAKEMEVGSSTWFNFTFLAMW